MDVDIRLLEGCDGDPSLLWDTVWQPCDGEADWQLADADEATNRGGLRAKAMLETAVTIALFTDRRVPPDHPLAYLADGDPRGWWGDGVDVRADLGEQELGSYLWLLERAPLTVRGVPMTMWAERFARDALTPLQAQGAVVRIDVQAAQNELRSRLELTVQLSGRDGAGVYDRKFDLMWDQVGIAGPGPRCADFISTSVGGDTDFLPYVPNI